MGSEMCIRDSFYHGQYNQIAIAYPAVQYIFLYAPYIPPDNRHQNSNFLYPIKLIYWDLPNRQTTICFTNFNIKLNLIALIKTRIINHSALHYHQVPKKCPTSPPTILPVFMRLCGIWQDHIFAFFLLNNALEWGRMFIKVVESGLKCIKVVRSGRFLG